MIAVDNSMDKWNESAPARSDRLRVGVAASAGGHLFQLQQLKPVYERYDYFYFTFSGPKAAELQKSQRVRSIPNIVRSDPWSWLRGCWLSLRAALQERPDVVLTTGAGVVVFFCLWSKLFGARVVYIESLAKVRNPTLTARFLYPFADRFFVQWPEMKRYFPKARYHGRLL